MFPDLASGGQSPRDRLASCGIPGWGQQADTAIHVSEEWSCRCDRPPGVAGQCDTFLCCGTRPASPSGSAVPQCLACPGFRTRKSPSEDLFTSPSNSGSEGCPMQTPRSPLGVLSECPIWAPGTYCLSPCTLNSLQGQGWPLAWAARRTEGPLGPHSILTPTPANWGSSPC